MSIRIMSQVWENGPDDREELLVLLALADFADDAGRCYPAMARIAAKARLTERGAQKIIARLRESGWLTVKTGGGRGGANVYTITNPERHSPNDIHRMIFTERGDDKPRTGVQETPNSRSPEPSVTIKEPSVGSARERAPAKRRSQVPESWEPSETDRAFAAKAGLSPQQAEREAARFRDYHRSRGTVFADHAAAWRTWVRKAVEFSKPPPAQETHADRLKRIMGGK